MVCEYEENSAYCTITEPENVIESFAPVCEAAGGEMFLFDDATLRCKAKIQNVGKITLTMHFVKFTECFAPSCDVSDDEAFEKAALNYIGGMLADEDDEINNCKYVD